MRRRIQNRFATTSLAALITLVAAHATAEGNRPGGADTPLPERVKFNEHIRPIMSQTCFACHGPDHEGNESGFMIDSFEHATATLPSDEELVGIRPGDPMASEVYLRVAGQSEWGERMPPEDFHHQLSDRDVALIRRWISQGAEYEQHWSYAPIERTVPPKPGEQAEFDSSDWTVNPIDAFVVDRLAREGLSPSPQADPATLLRRLSLDLVGLPPTTGEVDRFLAGEFGASYAAAVDRLLASPHFGERMASGWLDLVRYADTVGYHGDQNQRIFPYRDYVIEAFNENKPFDEFTREQLAGDLLPNPTDEQLVATGFLRLNLMTREGGAQPGEYVAKYKADRVRALGTVWLGSTLGCCECHNHKYDPFSAKDFYAFGAFFDDLRQWGVYSNYEFTPNPDLRGFTNNHPFPPEIRVASESLEALHKREEALRDERVAEEVDPEAPASEEFADWVNAMALFAASWSEGWAPLTIEEVDATGATRASQLEDGSVLLEGDPAADETLVFELSTPYHLDANAVRVEVLPHDSHAGRVGRARGGRFTIEKVEIELLDESRESSPAPVAWAQADRRAPSKYQGGRESETLDGAWRSGPARWQLPSNESRLTHTAVHNFQRPVHLGPGKVLRVRVTSGDVGRVRFAVTPIGHAVAGRAAIDERLRRALLTPAEQRDAELTATLVAAHHRSTLPIAEQSPTSRAFRDRILQLRSGLAMSLVAQPLAEDQVPVSRVRPRGDWQDDSGELAPPAFPEFLPRPDTSDDTRRLNRLDLADWLVSPENPLTARHYVNRLWKQFFGAGLSSTLDDLGSQGDPPSHPALLDWLASEFVRSGWDTKHLVRLIVTSNTYRQAAAVRDDLGDIDPYNRLLAQQSARRLEAEAIRDNALFAAGLLVTDVIGGPSSFPYQPAGYYRDIQFPNRKYVASDDWRQYRRGVYMHWQRTFLHPMLVNFDAPSRDECAADRPVSNSPQQALTLLNDPTFVEAANAMACDLLQDRSAEDFATVLEDAFQRVLARSPTPTEHEGLTAFFQQQLGHYRDHPEDVGTLFETGLLPVPKERRSAELAAYAQVCRVLLNLHETITRY